MPNTIQPIREFKPGFLFNQEKYVDTYQYGQKSSILGGVGDSAENIKARTGIYMKFPPKNMLEMRLCSTEWMNDINACISKNVRTLLLFSDRQSFRDYEYFLEKTGLSYDPGYTVKNVYSSVPNMILFVSDIRKVIENRTFLPKLKSVYRLVYFGGTSVDSSGQTVNYWHKHMHEVVDQLPAVTQVVVHRLGYDGPFESFESTVWHKKLHTIHLVQPGFFVISNISEYKDINLRIGYNFQNAHHYTPMTTLTESVDEHNLTVFYYQLMEWELLTTPDVDVTVPTPYNRNI